MSLPSPRLSDIPEEGLTFTGEILPEELGVAATDERFRGPLSLEVAFVREGTRVHVTGTLSGECVRVCVRCLREYQEAEAIPFSVEYRSGTELARRTTARAASAPRAQGRESPEAKDEEMDEVYGYTGEQIELTEMLREQIILAAPMQPLCRRDCRGLCPVCGQDLNVRACGCPQVKTDSPFSVLRDLQKKAGLN
jgi:uncharacterized protein